MSARLRQEGEAPPEAFVALKFLQSHEAPFVRQLLAKPGRSFTLLRATLDDLVADKDVRADDVLALAFYVMRTTHKPG